MIAQINWKSKVMRELPHEFVRGTGTHMSFETHTPRGISLLTERGKGRTKKERQKNIDRKNRRYARDVERVSSVKKKK